MELLSLDQLASIEGGIKLSSLIGIMCGATLALACTVYLIPLAAATGTGCAVGVYAISYWNSQGFDYE